MYVLLSVGVVCARQGSLVGMCRFHTEVRSFIPLTQTRGSIINELCDIFTEDS